MILTDVYEKYPIPPNLQRHMCRVAAVADQIIKMWNKDEKPDKNLVIQALLLHDIAKIIHFDFVNSTHLLEEEHNNQKYWEKAQDEFTATYGTDEHKAMLMVAAAVGVDQRVLDLLNEFGSTNVEYKVNSNNWHLKICTYSDFRTAPFGIVTVNERFQELAFRHAQSGTLASKLEKLEKDRISCLKLEEQIQKCVTQSLASISDETIMPFSELLNYQLGD